MHPVEFTWYKVLVLLAAALGLGVGILNVVYYNRIRVNNKCGDITSGEATTALWLNMILVIFAGIVFFWSMFRLIFSGAPEKEIVNKTYNTHYHSPTTPEPSMYSPTMPMPEEKNETPAPQIAIPSSPSTPVATPSTFSTVYEQPQSIYSDSRGISSLATGMPSPTQKYY